MKKTLKLALLFVLSMFLVTNVKAEDGVHYFLTYPNGDEVVVDTYDETNNPQERLIYVGTTNSSGEVTLNGWSEAQLRIVQRVPSGYTTDQQEFRVNLTNGGTVSFVDYRHTNPKTGQTILFLLVLIAILLATFLLVKKGNEKTILGIIAVLALIMIYQVKAVDNFTITVSDKEGNRLANVEIEIYAKPIHVEASPAIKFSANGGNFLDGETEMYARIPSNGCTPDEFWNSLTEEEEDYLWYNMMGAYRENYYPTVDDMPETLKDGDVVNVLWEENDEATLVTLDGNGGTYDFHGTKLNKIIGYRDSNLSYFAYEFQKNNSYVIGSDDNKSCSHYGTNGIWNAENELSEEANTYYVCWNSKPDGIYVDGVLFLGNEDSCYQESYLESLNNGTETYLSTTDYFVKFYNDDVIKHIYIEITFGSTIKSMTPLPQQSIHTIEIIKNNQVILSITEEDMSQDEYGYYISNAEKANLLQEYLENLHIKCVRV